MGKRQRFTKEFKREALRLWKSSGRPAAVVARELGLRRNHLYKWAELARLRREVARLREERDILKKAAAYFARESG
jgi:transposase